MPCTVKFNEIHDYKIENIVDLFTIGTKLEKAIIKKLADMLDTNFYIEIDPMSFKNSITVKVFKGDWSVLTTHTISLSDKNISSKINMKNPYSIKNAPLYAEILYLDYVDKNIDIKLNMLAGV